MAIRACVSPVWAEPQVAARSVDSAGEPAGLGAEGGRLGPGDRLMQLGPGCREGGAADVARRLAAATPVVDAGNALVFAAIDGQNGGRRRGLACKPATAAAEHHCL